MEISPIVVNKSRRGAEQRALRPLAISRIQALFHCSSAVVFTKDLIWNL